MEMYKLKKEIKYGWLILYLFLLVISGCSGIRGTKAVEVVPKEDLVLAMRIKAKLIETKELNAAAINVDASNGLVKLSGFVDTYSQRKLAQSITQQIPKVEQVDNQIKIK
ncbi:BON domain-containing protein [Nitrosomonas oligotropha]|uniref:BON domain-containing protein n=1 Tax=Nitrosomonas oligotropha TaxID=42354 RepID=UPI00136FCD4A|nr:BON domain-containing protein [Nitrosomonas oligotropha]